MKTLRFAFTFALLLTLLAGSTAFAQGSDDDPAGVNIFEVSPDPAYAGDTVGLDINFNATSGDGTTAFCLYAPDTAVDPADASNSFPASIVLTYYSGFSSVDVTFTGSASGCPARSGQTGWAYSASGLPTGDTTYEGSANFNIYSGAAAGFYDWTLLLQEPGSGTNPLSYTNHEIKTGTACTSLSGRLIDSKTLQPWVYGAEIEVIQTSGTKTGLKGSKYASIASGSEGEWSITLGVTDELNLGSPATGEPNAVYQIKINFTCDLETANGTRPDYQTTTDPTHCPITVNGTSLTGLPTNFEITYTDDGTGGACNAGDIETRRGPTAIVLEDFSAQSSAPWVLGGAAILLLAAGGLALLRRQWS